MASDAEILERVRQAFAGCPRPEHFTNYQHCCECAEHDDTLCSRDPDTLSMDDIGSPAWDPICFITPEGFTYYMPAFARLVLDEPDPKWGWYGSQFLFHLCHDGVRNVRYQACTPQQRASVTTLLQHILDTRAEIA